MERDGAPRPLSRRQRAACVAWVRVPVARAWRRATAGRDVVGSAFERRRRLVCRRRRPARVLGRASGHTRDGAAFASLRRAYGARFSLRRTWRGAGVRAARPGSRLLRVRFGAMHAGTPPAARRRRVGVCGLCRDRRVRGERAGGGGRGGQRRVRMGVRRAPRARPARRARVRRSLAGLSRGTGAGPSVSMGLRAWSATGVRARSGRACRRRRLRPSAPVCRRRHVPALGVSNGRRSRRRAVSVRASKARPVVLA
jgi:hypothetical protein